MEEDKAIPINNGLDSVDDLISNVVGPTSVTTVEQLEVDESNILTIGGHMIEDAATEVDKLLEEIKGELNNLKDDGKRLNILDALYRSAINVFKKTKANIMLRWTPIIDDNRFSKDFGCDSLLKKTEDCFFGIDLIKQEREEKIKILTDRKDEFIDNLLKQIKDAENAMNNNETIKQKESALKEEQNKINMIREKNKGKKEN